MPPKDMLSEERVEDSSEDESSTLEPTQTLKQRLDGIAKRASSTHLDRVSGSGNDGSDLESDTSSGSASSESTSSIRSKRTSHPAGDLTARSPSKRQKVDYNKIKRIDSTTYVPPHGYSTISTEAADMTALEIFENLEGKQIWHISAPSTMPVAVIESLDIAHASKGIERLSHEGITYEMSQTSVEDVTVLLPKGSSSEYGPVARAVTQAFRINESSRPKADEPASQGRDDHDGEADQTMNFFATEVGQRKPPREQPENMKARYVPYGVPANKRDNATVNSGIANEDASLTEASAAVATENEDASQRTPKSSKKTKHKKSAADDVNVDKTPLKQNKTSLLSPSLDTPASHSGSQKKTKEKRKKSVT